jgi:hypothetical protein
MTGIASADGFPNPFGPDRPGVYFENSGQNDWVLLHAEQAVSAELKSNGTVAQAKLDRGYSRAVLHAPLRLAVKIHEMEDIGSYRVYRLRSGSDSRTVRMNKPIPVEWVEIGFHLYELRLPEDLREGDYAVLPPAESADRVYAFHFRPSRTPGKQALAFR